MMHARDSEENGIEEALAHLHRRPIVDNTHVLNSVANLRDFQGWLIRRICEQERLWGYEVCQLSSGGCESRLLRFSYFASPCLAPWQPWSLETRMGAVRITSLEMDGLPSVAYGMKNAAGPIALLQSRYYVTIDAYITRPAISRESTGVDSTWLGTFQVEYVSRAIEITLKLLDCWMDGTVEDQFKGIEVTASDSQLLRYGALGAYPVEIFYFFRDLGPYAFDRLLDSGCLSNETYRIIMSRLRQMRMQRQSSL